MRIILVLLLCLSSCWGWGQDQPPMKKVRLTDITAITLHDGKMTNARRVSPIPQLKCVGGQASNAGYKPNVVQCYNRGSDGFDVQWECASEMPNQFKLGNVEVVCEGFDYPDDPFILQGSCGLEYTLEYSDKSQGQSSSYFETAKQSTSSDTFGTLFTVVFVAVLIYIIYSGCIRRDTRQDFSSTNDDSRPAGGGSGGFSSSGAPPSYGFRTDDPPSYDSCSGARNRGHYSSSAGAGSGGPGFWTGMGAGGLLGYLFSGNRNRGYGSGYGGYGGSSYGGYGGGRSSFGSGFSSGASTSSGATHSSSSYGGTRRR